MRKILGISAFYHDSAAALVVDGKIIAAVQEERFTRAKHTADFPIQSIQFCLNEGGYTIDELDAVVFYDKPLLKFERLLETYYAFAPKGIVSFLKAIPVWINEKLFLKKKIFDGLNELGPFDKKKLKLLFPEHHLSHAASAFFVSKYKHAAILTIDGVGEWSTATIGEGIDNKITFHKNLHFPHSVGLLYSAFTYYLGFKVNSGEYKLMGLAPYGNKQATQTKNFVDLIEKNLVDIKDDGSIWLNQSYFKYATGLRMVSDEKWKNLFGIGKRNPEDPVEIQHCNLASAIQTVTERIVIAMAKEAKRITKADILCMAGGVALNCVANGKLLKEKIFKDIYIQPAAGDAGGALGAAMAVHYMYFNEPRNIERNSDAMQGSYLGPSYSNKEIELMNRKVKANYHRYDSFHDLTAFIASKVKEGSVIGWFQGQMEFGPRALGNRSIIADPSNSEMQKKLNLKIKYREGFRPFAPSVLEEDLAEFFELDRPSPYMLMVADIRKKHQVPAPLDYDQLKLKEKLYLQRSNIQAITHVDYSARIQTVNQVDNPKYWQLLQAVKTETGIGMLINTSFNVRGEPIVNNPYDAFRCFMSTDMDYLVIGNFVYFKEDQNEWRNKEKWKQYFEKD